MAFKKVEICSTCNNRRLIVISSKTKYSNEKTRPCEYCNYTEYVKWCNDNNIPIIPIGLRECKYCFENENCSILEGDPKTTGCDMGDSNS